MEICLFLVLAITSSVLGQKTCSDNEVRNKCATACVDERTCQVPSPPPVDICTEPCVERCECDRENGFIRDNVTGECIKEEQCPDACPLNEQKLCLVCCEPATCQNRNPSPCNRLCPRICIRRCDCKEGYLRDIATGKCVLIEDCPETDICPLNEHKGCKPCCEPATCQNRNPEPCNKLCPRNCKRECQCEEGYLRDILSGKCVLTKDCPSAE